MEKDTDFEAIGRRSSYKVPEGFFNQISETTLREAKRREQNHRKVRIMLRTFAVAASLSAIAMLGYFMSKPETKLIVHQKQTEVNEIVKPTEAANTPVTLAETKKVAPKKQVVAVKTIIEETQPEEITTVLADLSNDELLELAALYKSDTFIDESQH